MWSFCFKWFRFYFSLNCIKIFMIDSCTKLKTYLMRDTLQFIGMPKKWHCDIQKGHPPIFGLHIFKPIYKQGITLKKTCKKRTSIWNIIHDLMLLPRVLAFTCICLQDKVWLGYHGCTKMWMQRVKFSIDLLRCVFSLAFSRCTLRVG
jgi:hypothetical protein